MPWAARAMISSDFLSPRSIQKISTASLDAFKRERFALDTLPLRFIGIASFGYAVEKFYQRGLTANSVRPD